jgi:hypothetical protein
MAKVKCLRMLGDREVLCSPEEAELVVVRVPQPFLGEDIDHSFRKLSVIKGDRAGTTCWSWNRDVNFPTFHPSVLVEVNYTEVERKDFRCHSFINDGKVQFLGDSSHEYAGREIELLDMD